MNLPKKAIIHCGVWRDWHSDKFAKIGIPNINRLLKEIPIPYEIIVQTETKQIPKFKDLKATFIPFFDKEQDHYQRSRGLTEIINKAWKEDAVVLWWPPDQYYSEGVWNTAFEKLHEGYRMIMQPSIRLVDGIIGTTMCPDNPRVLASVSKAYIHQMQKACNWDTFDKPPETKSCQQPCLYADCGQDGFVIKGFQGYIIAIYPTKFKECNLTQGQDGDLTQQLIDDVEQIYVLKDSDEGLCVDFSPKERFHGHVNYGKTKQDRLKYWASLNLNKAHLYMLLQTMIVHTGKITPKLLEAKKRLEDETHPTIEPIFNAKNLKFKPEVKTKEYGKNRLYVCMVILTDTDAIDFCNKRIPDISNAISFANGSDIKIKVFVTQQHLGKIRHSVQNYGLKCLELTTIALNKPKEALIPECQGQIDREAQESASTALFTFPYKEILRETFKEALK